MIPISKPTITQLEIDYVNDAVSSGWVSSLGGYIDRFEAGFSAFCGTRYAIAVSNGTAALHLALLAYGIGPGDEVIVPDFTFVATASAVTYTGAKPVFVDIDPDSLCVDPRRIEEAITSSTRAIIPVHIYGHPADMPAVDAIAKKYNLIVIEDASEAHGASVGDRMVGSLGDAGIFSFYGNKVITSGEGGMITTDDETIDRKIRLLRDHAMSKGKRYWHDEIGYNYRITNLQAALAVAQMERLDDILQKKERIFSRYYEHLSPYPSIRLNRTASGVFRNIYWMVTAEIDGFDAGSRDRLITMLGEKGIETRPYFYPVSDLPAFERSPGMTPVTHDIYGRGICLPSFFELKDEEIDYICTTLTGCISRYRPVHSLTEERLVSC